jgi:hypothetical protein
MELEVWDKRTKHGGVKANLEFEEQTSTSLATDTYLPFVEHLVM